MRIETTIPPGTESVRIDRFLVSLEGIDSRGMAQRLIREGRVSMGGIPVTKASTKVEAGTVLTCDIPETSPSRLVPVSIPLDILYEDEAILVVNKPPHMVIHPAPGHVSDTLVNALLAHTPHLASLGGEWRPGIVHRLDKGTSGVLVVAKSNEAYLNLAGQFRNRGVKKTYLAMVHGRLEPEEGMIDHAIMRSSRDRKRMAVSREPETGRQAVTRWKVQATYPGLTFVSLHPETGRTHQLRVHLSAMGHPILGDPVYGRRRFPTTGALAPLFREVKTLGRQALHAYKITFEHPKTGKRMVFTAPCPEDLHHLHQRIEEIFSTRKERA